MHTGSVHKLMYSKGNMKLLGGINFLSTNMLFGNMFCVFESRDVWIIKFVRSSKHFCVKCYNLLGILIELSHLMTSAFEMIFSIPCRTSCVNSLSWPARFENSIVSSRLLLAYLVWHFPCYITSQKARGLSIYWCLRHKPSLDRSLLGRCARCSTSRTHGSLIRRT